MINPKPVYGQRSPYGSPAPSETPGLPPKAPVPKPKKRWPKVVGIIVAALFVGGLTFAISSYVSLRNNIIVSDAGTKNAAILGYDPNGKATLNPNDFSKLGDGRFNMLLIGVDSAAGLTDSIQLLSIDTINKQATVTSIPRDLYVTIPGYGRSKINAAYKVAEAKKAGNGSAMLKDLVGQITGTTITNYALTNFNGLEQVVDSLGGITVDVPKAIYDPFFPAAVGDGFAPFSIKAGVQELNGKVALEYARSRETTSDFDRSKRQKLIVDAIRKKATSLGVVTNPVKITNLISALGHSFKTDVQLDQLSTLLNIYNGISDANNKSFTLDTSAELGLLTDSSDTPAGYISYPLLGIDHYTDIQRWFRKNNPDPLLTKEHPTITIANGSKATTKQLTDLAALLTDYGYTVVVNSTYTPTTRLTATQVYDTTSGQKPFSHNYLAGQFATSVKNSSPLGSGSNFEILYVPSSTPIPSPTFTPSASPSPSPSPTF